MNTRSLSLAPSVRPVIAAVVAALLVIAGVITAPVARAAGGTISGTVTAASASGLTVQVQASGLGEVASAYAAMIPQGREADVTGAGGYTAFAIPFPTITDGATSFTLSAPAAKLDRATTYEVLIWTQHSAPNASTIYARADVAISAGQWDAVFGPITPEPTPEPTAEPTPEPTQTAEPTPTPEPTQTATPTPTPEPTQTPAPTPTLEVFAADGVTPVGDTALKAGDTIVVKGSGYDPTANVGGRGMPIPNTLPQGTYVVFGNFAETWQPSAGAASSTRSVGTQGWALAASVLDQVPAQFQGAIRAQWVELAADGTFTATLVLKDAAATPGSYGVYTYGAGGVTNAAQERHVALSYAPAPKVSATVTAAPDSGLTVGVSGRDFGSAAGVYAAVIEKGSESSVTAASGYVAMQYVRGISGGQFTTSLVASSEKLDRAKTYEVLVWKQHTMPSASTILARTDIALTDAQWDALFPPAVTAEVSDASKDGLSVAAAGERIPASGAYVALIESGSEGSVTAAGGFVAMQYVRGISDGAFTVDLVAPAEKLDRAKTYEVLVWKQHTMPSADTIYARGSLAVTGEQWGVVFPAATPTPTPTPTPTVTPAPTPTTPAQPVAGGSLRWAFSSSFVNYITGPIAHGQIAVSGGATRSGGQFQFGQAAGSTYDPATGLGAVDYIGTVRFTGHGGVLDVTIANPQIRITSPNAATLYVSNGGSRVAFATLDLGAAARTTCGGAVTYTAAPATLTSAGLSNVLSGYSTSLNPVTFTVGVPAAAPQGTTGTVAAAAVTPKARTLLPAAPPATGGITLTDDQREALQSGGQVTVSASGFEANERGIRVVVYSTPTLLDTVTADADGVATWTGSMPATLADGAHTLTFQASVSRGVEFILDRAAAQATSAVVGACTATGATLSWGFKESFRTYIEGIAKGGWELSGLEYVYPNYVWDAGTGALDLDTRTGLVTYGGSIRFTGHDGALDTTLSNVRLELAGDVGYVVVDVTGTTQEGAPIAAEGIRFAEFALPDLEVTDGALVLDALPATLTDAGADAFGTYEAGSELDPISATIPVDADCGAAPVEEDAPVAAAPEKAKPIAAVTDGAPAWPWLVGGGVALLAIGLAAGVLIGRRRTAAE